MDSDLEANALLIDDHFTIVFEPCEISCVNEAMQYALLGGKKLRGYLVNQSSKLFEIDPDPIPLKKRVRNWPSRKKPDRKTFEQILIVNIFAKSIDTT